MVFNATFNNISVISLRSVLLVEESGEPGENYRPATSHCQNLSHNVVSSTPRHCILRLLTYQSPVTWEIYIEEIIKSHVNILIQAHVRVKIQIIFISLQVLEVNGLFRIC